MRIASVIRSLGAPRRPRLLALLLALALTLIGAVSAFADCHYTEYPWPIGRSTSAFRPPIMERAKDFAALNVGGVTHLFYTRVTRDLAANNTENDFGHAYSFDLLNWTPASTVNPDGDYTTGGAPIHPAWSARHVWAPSIVQSGSTYYMFYTGVDVSDNQCIGVSTSTDLSHWTPYGNNPVLTAPMVPWAKKKAARQFRDPFVMRDVIARDGTQTPGWLLYYSALDSTGVTTSIPAIGVAWASYGNLYVWHDLVDGSNNSVSKLLTSAKTESPHLILHGSSWYLFFSDDPGIGYVANANPVTTSWGTPAYLPTVLGNTQAAGNPITWFASEAVTIGSNDYLFFVHDFDPAGPCDPLWTQYPATCPPTASALDARTIAWNQVGTTQFLPNLLAGSDGTQWTEQCVTAAPAPRWQGTMVFDAANSRMVLFGGMSSASNGSSPVYYNDAWSYNTVSKTWTQFSPAGTPPPARFGHGAIYDAPRQRMLVLGGYGPAVGDNRTVYALSLSGTPTWSVVSTNGSAPPSTFSAPMGAVYDSDRDQLVTVDLYTGVRKLVLSTSTWGLVSPALPEFPREGTTVYDPTHQRLLFVGGWDAYTGGGNPCPQNVFSTPYVYSMSLTQSNLPWTQISVAPWPGRYQATAYVDVSKGKLVIFGGIAYAQGCTCVGPICGSVSTNHEVPYNDVWAMDLNTLAWTQFNPPGGTLPPARGHQMAGFDPLHVRLEVFGGGDYKSDASHVNCLSNCTAIPTYTYRNDTWSFRPDGTPPAQTTTLAVGGTYRNGATLNWTAPGDDGTVGTATAYDLRYYPGGPLDEGNWYLGFQIPTGQPQPSGSSEYACTDQLASFTYYWFMLKTQDLAGNWSQISNTPWGATKRSGPMILCDGFRLREVDGERNDVPVALEFSPARPNPSRGETQFDFGIPRDFDGRPVDITVFDVAGRRTRTLFAGPGRAGRYSVDWDLRDEGGSSARSGLYFVRLAVDGRSQQTRTVQVVR